MRRMCLILNFVYYCLLQIVMLFAMLFVAIYSSVDILPVAFIMFIQPQIHQGEQTPLA